jgi:hypothetical protein
MVGATSATAVKLARMAAAVADLVRLRRFMSSSLSIRQSDRRYGAVGSVACM